MAHNVFYLLAVNGFFTMMQSIFQIGYGGRCKPVVFITGGLHSREWLAVATVVYFVDKVRNAEKYANHSESVADLIQDEHQIFILTKCL